MRKTIVLALFLEYSIILGSTYYNKKHEITLFKKPKSKFF